MTNDSNSRFEARRPRPRAWQKNGGKKNRAKQSFPLLSAPIFLPAKASQAASQDQTGNYCRQRHLRGNALVKVLPIFAKNLIGLAERIGQKSRTQPLVARGDC